SFFFTPTPRRPPPTPFPYTTLFRSQPVVHGPRYRGHQQRRLAGHLRGGHAAGRRASPQDDHVVRDLGSSAGRAAQRFLLSVHPRSEEHTSELQSRVDLVCRLLLEKK